MATSSASDIKPTRYPSPRDEIRHTLIEGFLAIGRNVSWMRRRLGEQFRVIRRNAAGPIPIISDDRFGGSELRGASPIGRAGLVEEPPGLAHASGGVGVAIASPRKVVYPAEILRDVAPVARHAVPEWALPTKVEAVSAENLSPLEILVNLRDRPAEERPAVLCIDAMSLSMDRIGDWLEGFDLIWEEQSEKFGALLVPHRVVFHSPGLPIHAVFANAPGVEWVPAPADAADICTRYFALVRERLAGLYSMGADRASAPGTVPDGLVDAFEAMPDDERDQFRARLDEIGRSPEF